MYGLLKKTGGQGSKKNLVLCLLGMGPSQTSTPGEAQENEDKKTIPLLGGVENVRAVIKGVKKTINSTEKQVPDQCWQGHVWVFIKTRGFERLLGLTFLKKNTLASQ